MQETYTFSRALHLMRYGGITLSPINHINGVVSKVQFKVVGGYLFHKYGRDYITGSWVEVK